MSLSDGTPMMTMPVAPANNYGGGMGMVGPGLDLDHCPVFVWLGPQWLWRERQQRRNGRLCPDF